MPEISRRCANSNFPRTLLRKGFDALGVSWGSSCKQTTESTITISRVSDPRIRRHRQHPASSGPRTKRDPDPIGSAARIRSYLHTIGRYPTGVRG